MAKHIGTLTEGTLYVQLSTGLTYSNHIQFISTYPHIYIPTYIALQLVHINYIYELFIQYYFIIDMHIILTSVARKS